MRNLSRLVIAVALILPACRKNEAKQEPTTETAPASGKDPWAKEPAKVPTAPKGLYDPPPSADNPSTPEKIALGKQLFFDKRLSKDGSASCESCHFHDKGWTDNLPFSTK